MEHTIRLHPLLACIRRLFGLGETDLQYINGPQTLPAPLSREDEAALIERIETDEEARRTLVEHNLRLVVYIAKKFENTAAGIEDLISIGTIGLMKAINTFKSEKQIKLATYASRCIENEILMYIRKSASQRHEMSLDEPLNIDWDGNELLLSDLLGTENDYVYRNIEENEDRRIIMRALDNLSPRDREIIRLRYGLPGSDTPNEEKTQKEVADMLGISHSYISRLEKRIIVRLKEELTKLSY